MKLTKPWTPEKFLGIDCDAREEPISRRKTTEGPSSVCEYLSSESITRMPIHFKSFMFTVILRLRNIFTTCYSHTERGPPVGKVNRKFVVL